MEAKNEGVHALSEAGSQQDKLSVGLASQICVPLVPVHAQRNRLSRKAVLSSTLPSTGPERNVASSTAPKTVITPIQTREYELENNQTI